MQLTDVIFTFYTPQGEPVGETDFTIQLVRPGYSEQIGVVQGETLYLKTNMDGTAVVSLAPSNTPYYVKVDGPDFCSQISYKFYVIESDVPVNFQDLIDRGQLNPSDLTQETIRLIIESKVIAVQAAEEALAFTSDSLASEVAAKASEDSALAAETAAKAAAMNSQGSADAALASKNVAKISETNAKTSETNATTAAFNATTEAGKAAASVTAAKTSETNAKASETNTSALKDSVEQTAAQVQQTKNDTEALYNQALAIGSGWSPVLKSIMDGSRAILQITDWTGGRGTKPPVGYVGPNGVVATAANALDIRGANGVEGKSFTVNATGTLAGLSAYNSQAEGFAYLATDNGMLYLRQGAAGNWSPGIPFGKGDRGDKGDTGLGFTQAQYDKLDAIEAGATRDWGQRLLNNGTDLNGLKDLGSWVCATNASAATILNKPAANGSRAFSVQVFASSGVTQLFTAFDRATMYMRTWYNFTDTWSEWEVFYNGTNPQTTTTTDAAGTNNTNIASTAFVQQAVSGQIAKDSSGGTITLTAAEASNIAIRLTGTLTSNLTVNIPVNTVRPYVVSCVMNMGAFKVTIRQNTASVVDITEANKNVPIWCDGQNVFYQDDVIRPISVGGTGTNRSTGTGAVVLDTSPNLAGNPTANLQGVTDNSTRLANTQFVKRAVDNSLVSPALTGTPTAPTPATTDNSTNLATTAHVQAVKVAETGAAGYAVKLKTARNFSIDGAIAAASRTFDGTGDVVLTVNGMNVEAATAGTLPVIRGGTGVTTSTGLGANVLAISPAIDGTPTAPTAAPYVSNNQLATTEFVKRESITPLNTTNWGTGYANGSNVVAWALQWTTGKEWAQTLDAGGTLGWHTFTNNTWIGKPMTLEKSGNLSIAGRLYAPLTNGRNNAPAVHQTGDIGSAFSYWNTTAEPVVQVNTPSNLSAYMIWRATRQGYGHLAAMSFHESAGSTCMVTMSMAGGSGSNQFRWYSGGGYECDGSVTAAGVVLTSDTRLKDLHGGVTGALDKLSRISKVFYNFKGETAKHLGYTAQSVEAVLPEAVTERDAQPHEKKYVGDKVKVVDYNAVAALQAQAIDELHALLKKQQLQIDALIAALAAK